MSNDKVAATYGPAVEYLHLTTKQGDVACGDFLGASTVFADRVNCLQCLAVLRGETTGEHTKAKLADNPYGGVTSAQAADAAAWSTSQLAQHTGSSVPGVPYDYEKAEPQSQYLKDMAKCRCLYAPGDPDELRKNVPGKHHAQICDLYRRPVRRPWTPTHRELVVAGFIACLIIGATGWVFRLLG